METTTNNKLSYSNRDIGTLNSMRTMRDAEIYNSFANQTQQTTTLDKDDKVQ